MSGKVNPYQWRSHDWPETHGVGVEALGGGGGARVTVSVGSTFMGIMLTAEQTAEMGAVLTEFSRPTPDSGPTEDVGESR